jgi:hypothetical protein
MGSVRSQWLIPGCGYQGWSPESFRGRRKFTEFVIMFFHIWRISSCAGLCLWGVYLIPAGYGRFASSRKRAMNFSGTPATVLGLSISSSPASAGSAFRAWGSSGQRMCTPRFSYSKSLLMAFSGNLRFSMSRMACSSGWFNRWFLYSGRDSDVQQSRALEGANDTRWVTRRRSS